VNATLVLTDIHLCVEACWEATSPVEECDCRCGGDNHGRPHRAGIQAAKAAVQRRTTGGFTPGMLAAINDEEIF
jgi:hypothetical protein